MLDNLALVERSLFQRGNDISISIDYDTADPTEAPASPVVVDPDLFNLIIYVNGVKTEEHLMVTVNDTDIRYLPRVLQQSSSLLEIVEDSPGSGTWTIPDGRPLETVDQQEVTTAGTDGSTLTFTEYLGAENLQTGLYALKKTDLFNLLCIPPPER